MQAIGLTVIRVRDGEVRRNLEGVTRYIMDQISAKEKMLEID